MKISIIGGAGRVGTAIAYALINGAHPKEIVLIDIMKNLVMGEALDLGQAAVALSPETKVTGTDDYSALRGSDVVVFTAGRARKPDETREALFDFNAKIAKDASAKIKEYAPHAKVIVVTNPSTQIGKVVLEATGFPREQIIVMDNQLDTARLKYFIRQETGMSISQIRSHAKGEHGENMDFEMLDKMSAEQAANVRELTKGAGMSIIKLKNYTCWGIAAQVAEEVKKLKQF